jgi:hypothetical protein
MNAVLQDLVIPRSEIIKLAAVDSIFYCRQFFPKTFRQASPYYHRDFWQKFEDPTFDLFGAEIFRGGAKTTLTRAGISKRIAFGVSRNILAVAISESMAIHTIRWLKRAIETNQNWTNTFMLRKGAKWTDDWIEIINEPFDCTINVVAKGMTSGLRGLNPDDWRPDFIFCDDISNEETVGTEEQRNKNSDLFFGALVPTLAPKSEAPMRKLVLAQTALHKDDIISKAHNDPAFQTVKYPKLIEHPNGELESAWPERFPVEEVVKERDDYAKRNQYHIWLREYGCKIISRETAPLDGEWLREYKSLPTNLRYYIGLDPATDSQKKKVHRTAIAVIGVEPTTADVYLIDYFAQKGKNPDEIWTWLVAAYRKYRPRKVGTETIAFQKMLAWYFKQKMLESKTFFVIDEIQDKRSKASRILQAFNGLAAAGKFWINPNHTEFKTGFTEWTEEVDWDLGDAIAQAITLANPWMATSSIDGDAVDGDIDSYEDEKEIPDLVFEGGAP